MKMGIIAEEKNDVEVLKALTLRLLRPKHIGFKSFVGHGSGKLRSKCRAWVENLVNGGCSWIAVVHDLDINNERILRAELTSAIDTVRTKGNVVLIPKKEIESWLLYDANAIAKAFKDRRLPRLLGNPETLRDPKKYLRDIIWSKYRKPYLHTVHNEMIAKHIRITCLARSSSFTPHRPFVRQIKQTLR